jgi:hypothetical protein
VSQIILLSLFTALAKGSFLLGKELIDEEKKGFCRLIVQTGA